LFLSYIAPLQGAPKH